MRMQSIPGLLSLSLSLRLLPLEGLGTRLPVHVILLLSFQNGVTAYDVAKLSGHKAVCDELEHRMNQETKTEVTLVSASLLLSSDATCWCFITNITQISNHVVDIRYNIFVQYSATGVLLCIHIPILSHTCAESVHVYIYRYIWERNETPVGKVVHTMIRTIVR